VCSCSSAANKRSRPPCTRARSWSVTLGICLSSAYVTANSSWSLTCACVRENRFDHRVARIRHPGVRCRLDGRANLGLEARRSLRAIPPNCAPRPKMSNASFIDPQSRRLGAHLESAGRLIVSGGAHGLRASIPFRSSALFRDTRGWRWNRFRDWRRPTIDSGGDTSPPTTRSPIMESSNQRSLIVRHAIDSTTSSRPGPPDRPARPICRCFEP